MRTNRLPESRWRPLVAEQARSGLTLKAFAKSRGVSLGALTYWKYTRLRWHEGHGSGFAVVDLVGAPPGDRGGTDEIDVLLVGGHRLRVRRGFDEELLLRLVATLERPC